MGRPAGRPFSLRTLSTAEPMTITNKLRIGILGASGYTGAELLRLLARHPGVDLRLLTADRQAGRPIAEIFPHLGALHLPVPVKIEAAEWSDVDLVFCCLPHGTTQEVIAGLPAGLKIVDLSADFRLADPASYAEWYGHEPRHPLDHLCPAGRWGDE